MKVRKYNRGEWAELYVLVKILCDQEIRSRSSIGSPSEKPLKVVQVLRGDGAQAECYELNNEAIVCEHASRTIPRTAICELVEPILSGIKKGSGISFELDVASIAIDLLGIERLKAGSNSKSDILLEVEDPLSSTRELQGYTIKALLRSRPTLVNASGPTNFRYQIDPPLTEVEIDHYNSRDSHGHFVFGPRHTVSDLISRGHKLTLIRMDERFRSNLELIDSDMPDYISDALLAYYSRAAGNSARTSMIADALAAKNLRGFNNPLTRYQHKIKDFLEASAYGMTPSAPFNGERSASGGLLIVERDGSLTCFRLDNKDETRQYLYDHTHFETASRTKHDFGVIRKEGPVVYLDLNLQIRYM